MKKKEIFVVDGGLDITSIQVEEVEWEKEVFGANIGSQPIIVCRGGWNKLTTYGGFETKAEAEKFRDMVKKHEENKTKTSLTCFDDSDCKPREKPSGFCDGCGG